MATRPFPGTIRDAGKRASFSALLGVWAAAVGLAPTLEAKLLAIAAPTAALAWWTLVHPERWLALFFFCALLLPPLPFPFGNAGIHVAPLAALLGIAAGILRVRAWRIRDFGTHRILATTFLVFPVILLLSVAFAAVYSGWEIAAESLVRVLLLGISAYIFLYALAGPRGDSLDTLAFTRMLFGFALAGAVFACADFYFQFPAPAGYGGQFIWLEKTVLRRAQGVFYESSTLGNFCAFFLVMTLVLAFLRKERSQPRIISGGMLLTGAAIFTAALILSASRASVVTVVVASIVLLFMQRARRTIIGSRVIVVTGLSLAAAALTIRLTLPEFAAHYWTRTVASVQNFGSAPDAVLSGRLTHWRVLTDFVLQHPWHIIFGIGYKTLPYTNYLGSSVVADNTYLSLLVETGIAGLSVFLFWNIAILRAAYRAARSRSARASFFGLWIFCFWCGELVQMLSGDLITYWRVLPVYFWVLAAALRESTGPSTAEID